MATLDLKKLVATCTVALAFGMIAGCATTKTATGKATFGDPIELNAMVMAGQVPPNAYLPVYEGETTPAHTPLCSLIYFYTAAAANRNSVAAVDYLLSHGADVNKPCTISTDGKLYLDKLPLDTVYILASARATPPDRYQQLHNSSNYQPDLLPAVYALADKLIQRGARPAGASLGYGLMTTKPGTYERDPEPITLIKFKQHVEFDAKERGKAIREEEEARLAADRRDKENNANTLRGLATVAGMAANNYRAIETQRQASLANASLPLANVKTIPPAQNTSVTPTTKTPASGQSVIGAEKVKPGNTQLYTTGAAGTQVSDADAAKLGAKMAGIPLDKLNTPKPSSTVTTTASAPASPIVESKASPAKAASADFDALGSTLPKTQPYSFSCGGHSGLEVMPAEAPDNCIAEMKQFMRIQCFPGWMVDQSNISRLRCSADKSRGRYKLEHSNLLKVYQSEARKVGCSETGCTGRDHLGNI